MSPAALPGPRTSLTLNMSASRMACWRDITMLGKQRFLSAGPWSLSRLDVRWTKIEPPLGRKMRRCDGDDRFTWMTTGCGRERGVSMNRALDWEAEKAHLQCRASWLGLPQCPGICEREGKRARAEEGEGERGRGREGEKAVVCVQRRPEMVTSRRRARWSRQRHCRSLH
jgi:hypothetical protein